YVDCVRTLPRPLPLAAIVGPTKDDNTKANKSKVTKHDGYSASPISADACDNNRSLHSKYYVH
nr:hypothetical protein [Tanacetum cinerariifolium]